MSRNFPDFLTSYGKYAHDAFVPDRFHDWAALSLIAGVVERKVTLQRDLINYFPNIYIMLVSHPKGGKSTAIDRAADLMEDFCAHYKNSFRIIPNQATEPALIDLMKYTEYFQVSPSLSIPQSAGYFYASEASASALQNTCGDFVATMTAFYDCPRYFRKKLKGEQTASIIENSCMNLLAGTTFDYLKNLVNASSVMGGFASRLIYVVSPERKVRDEVWGGENALDVETRKRLVADLDHINRTVMGPMKPTKGWIERYLKWQTEFDKYIIDLGSARMESIMARKDVSLIKTSILLSISESDSRVIEERHFEKALHMIDECYKDNSMIIAEATMADSNSQAGLNQLIARVLKRNGGFSTIKNLRALSMSKGHAVEQIDKTINFMASAGWLEHSSDGNVKLLIDPDRHL